MIFRLKIVVFAAFASAVFPHGSRAQDVPGIEICTAEKTMERRTGCLQSNVNFLQSGISKLTLESQRKLDAANRQIEALRGAVVDLQKSVAELRAAQVDKPAAATPDAAKTDGAGQGDPAKAAPAAK